MFMHAIVLAGVQASGKSSFCRERFFRTHGRLSLDLLGTREREDVLLHACLALGQPFVIDNTNPLAKTRARYASLARSAGFRSTLYWLQSAGSDAVSRNAARAPDERVPVRAIYGTLKKFQPPTPEEGFDEAFVVRLGAAGFTVLPLTDVAL
jgi:predicted kinase